MLRTSIAAVVLGCFCFCPLDYDASVMVDCAAVGTGGMLEKYMVPAKGCNKIRVNFYFWSRCCCCCCCCVLLLLPTTSVLKRRYYFFFFWWLRCCCSSLIERHVLKKNKIGFCFLFDTGTQSIAFSVTGYVLLLFLTAPGSCLQHQY